MIARSLRNLRERGAGRRTADRGLSLVELLIAMTLTLILSGVLVAAILTSLNVAGATSDNLKTSVDVRLVSAYLARDAQGAGGTDPTTVQQSSRAGVSTTAGDWNGCDQSGADMVVRFSWVDYVDIRTQRDVTVTWALNGADLFRQYCEDGATKNIVRLGRTLETAVASCDTACSGSPTSVSLTVTGNNGKSEYSTTMSASLRPRGQDFPTEDSASTVTFLALGNGTPTPCTNVALGTATAYVVGDAVVNVNDAACEATALTPGTSSIVHPPFGSPSVTGATSITASINDPLAATTAPTDSCGGSNPALGTPGVYPDKLTITEADGAVVFTSGTYVFCKGLDIQAGASVVSSGGVFLYLKGGTLTIDPAAAVELSAIRTGIDQRNIVVWVATEQTVSIGTGAHITRLGGTVYAPNSDVVFTGNTESAAVNVGVIIAATVTVNTSVPIARFGPIPTLSITPTTLEPAKVGADYQAQLSLAGDGAAQMVNPTWSATGLSPFTIDPDTGLISGNSACPQTLQPTVRVVDDTGLAVSTTYVLEVAGGLTLSDPGAYVRGTKTLRAVLDASCAGSVTSVALEYALSGSDEDGDGEPDWQALGTAFVTDLNKPTEYTYAWDTTEARFLGPDDNGNLTVDGTAFDLRAVATLDDASTYVSNIVASVVVDNTSPTITLNSPGSSPFSGTVTLTADAVDGETGVKAVSFEVTPAGTEAWMEVCRPTTPFDPANQTLYLCEWDTTSFVPDVLGAIKYDVRASVTDLAGNWASDKITNLTINNSGASISVSNPGPYVRGNSVTITAIPFVPTPASITSVRIQYKRSGGSWTDLCTRTEAPWTCTWDTTALVDDEYSLQAILLDSRPLTTTSDPVTTIVDNSTFFARDVQANNGNYEKKKADATHPTMWFREKFGKINGLDTLTLTYSKSVQPSSIIAGWDGSSRSIFIRLLDGQFVGMKANTTAKVSDVMDFCTSWDTATKKGMQCSGTGTSSNPNLGKGTGLGYVQLNADFVDGWDNNANNRKAAILYGSISVSGSTVRITIGTPCPTANIFERVDLPPPDVYVCTAGSAKVRGPDSPKDSKTPKKTSVMVWIPSASALANDAFNTPASTRPGPETGNLDRDF